MLLVDGQVLVDPPNEQLAQALGARTRPAARRYDVAVVGAWTGRAGRGDLCRLRRACHTAVGTGGDRRPGGHDLPDRNYLGFQRGVSGGELAARAAEQAVVFGAELVYAQPATRSASPATPSRSPWFTAAAP